MCWVYTQMWTILRLIVTLKRIKNKKKLIDIGLRKVLQWIWKFCYGRVFPGERVLDIGYYEERILVNQLKPKLCQLSKPDKSNTSPFFQRCFYAPASISSLKIYWDVRTARDFINCGTSQYNLILEIKAGQKFDCETNKNGKKNYIWHRKITYLPRRCLLNQIYT
jgi:hypothetical protein